MYNNLIKTTIVCLGITLFASACKKDDDTPAKEYLISKLGETAFEYNAAGQAIRLGTDDSYTSLFYNGDKVVKKVVTSNFAIYQIDSLYYDGSGRLIRAETFEIQVNQPVKKSTTELAYNADGSVNTITVDFVNAFTFDQLYELTYNGKHLVQRIKKENSGSGYKMAYKEELLAFDDKANPLDPIHKKYLLDSPETIHVAVAGPNNPTSYKKTNYDLVTGNETSVETANFSYTYNADNLPSILQISQGGSTTPINIEYIEKP